jgi:hypothetical protein
MMHVLGGAAYEASSEGKRLLVNKADQGTSDALSLVTNWQAVLEQQQ